MAEKKSIINLTNNVDFTKEPLFFGQGLNIQRYDKFRYNNIFEFFKKQIGFFWRPEEVAIGSKERTDFASLTDHQRFIFTKNLGYQILLDSIQSRGIANLLEYCSNPEVEAFAKSWEFFETVHSYSYTYIIKNVYPNPSEIFDNILNDPEIIKRTSSVTKYYDDLIDSIPDDSLDTKKKKLYLTLMSINILEGVRFYVSFACSYAFAQNKKMEGNAKIISLINRRQLIAA
jgi:ribonucleotide reductase beta subunit family protein with ferritin-like domain